jgi:hypothetical protein
LGTDASFNFDLLRVGLEWITVQSMERCLAQGEVSGVLLANAQRELSEESQVPVFLHLLRGERAWMHMMMVHLKEGNVDPRIVYGPAWSSGDFGELTKQLLQGKGSAPNYEADHARKLRLYNEVVEYAKLPAVQMRVELDEVGRRPSGLAMSLAGTGQGVLRARTALECAVAGISAERFRLQYGRWPDSLGEVVAAKLLDSVPIDYFDGKPLRYRKAIDGVVVYSIGPYGDYCGDALDKSKSAAPYVTRVEFRIWDEAHRRQPPPPRPKADQKSDDQ